MAFGQHWEWRGFGRVSDDLRARIEALDLRFDSGVATIDTYLWTPNGPANVKLRHGDLKFKRLLESDGDLQHWLEDEKELHPFPLNADVVEALAQALAITLPEGLQTPVGRNELVELLKNAHPPVQILLVEKYRRFFSLPTGTGDPVIVELTDIVRPELVSSVALEHADIDAVRQGLAQLGLTDNTLCPLHYLEALSIWAADECILHGRSPSQKHP